LITEKKPRLHTVLSQRFHSLCAKLEVVLAHVKRKIFVEKSSSK